MQRVGSTVLDEAHKFLSGNVELKEIISAIIENTWIIKLNLSSTSLYNQDHRQVL